VTPKAEELFCHSLKNGVGWALLIAILLIVSLLIALLKIAISMIAILLTSFLTVSQCPTWFLLLPWRSCASSGFLQPYRCATHYQG